MLYNCLCQLFHLPSWYIPNNTANNHEAFASKTSSESFNYLHEKSSLSMSFSLDIINDRGGSTWNFVENVELFFCGI